MITNERKESKNTVLESKGSELRDQLRLAHARWRESGSHAAWIHFVIKHVIELDEDVLREGHELPDALRLGDLQPTIVATNPVGGRPALLICTHAPGTHLDKPKSESLSTPTSEMRMLLQHAQVSLGIITDGEEWRVLSAKPGEPERLTSFYASEWLGEPLRLRAFRSLFGMGSFFALQDEETIEEPQKKPEEDTDAVTNQLRKQVRSSVEVLVRELGRAPLKEVTEKELYEAASTVMMRIIVLIYAEERGLIGFGHPEYKASYAVSTMREQIQGIGAQHCFDAWARLLATFRTVHGGGRLGSMEVPAHKGLLFDPSRFPFLEGELQITNLTVLQLLESVQLSFNNFSVEQIGHVYEELLDYTAQRADEIILGLKGGQGLEPKISLASLEQNINIGGTEAFARAYKKSLGRADKAILDALEADIDPQRLEKLQAVCGQDDALVARVKPFAGLIKDDALGYPMVFRKGEAFVTEGTDRQASGSHYTPPQITEPIVKHTLDPVVYDGPACGKPESEWVLKPAQAILDLKVCDIAAGAGAFLMQVVRYLGDRLVEAWEKAERPLPEDLNERVILARRAVVSRCIYGVDKNPMAVELSKLTLWLETSEKNTPFTFLDHALKAGDSLSGVASLDSLESLTAAEKGPWTPFHWPFEFPEVMVGGGFDAIVGNPPFLGGNKIARHLGKDFREFLVEHLAGGKRGPADLCAYFFLRAYALLKANGGFGLVATNTISKGHSREIGLDVLVERGAVIYRASPSERWRGKAKVHIARVWVRKSGKQWRGESILSGKQVPQIGPHLAVSGAAFGAPYPLAANAGKASYSPTPAALGAIVTHEEARELIAKDLRNADVLFPYLSGKDLQTHPEQKNSSWMINFF